MMRMIPTFTKPVRPRRRNERGAALISALLMSTMLLTAGGALILTTALSATNTYDSTAETQAYYAAEAGLQATLNVLRGNVAPTLNYRAATTPSTSNKASDTVTTWARLSNWLTYSDVYTDRVILTSPPESYSPISGSAFNAVLSDPDTSTRVTFSTSGDFKTCNPKETVTVTNGVVGCGSVSGGNKVGITYIPQAETTLTAYPSVASLLGSFQVQVSGGGSGMPAAGIPFTLTINQTAPWAATLEISCTLKGDTLNNGTSTVDVDFGSLVYDNQGTVLTLGSKLLRLNPVNTSGGLKTIPVTLDAPQPRRVLVRVNGYGPRGSRKQMEMMVGRFVFEYTPRSLIALRSADNGAAMTFDDGSSAAHSYSGNAATGNQAIAAFAVTSTIDAAHLTGLSGTVSGNPVTQKVEVETLSSWLQDADEARRTLNKLEGAAKAQDRYFTAAAPPSSYGTAAAPEFTFVDGDCNPGGGAGLVVCTGTVLFNGNDNFSGLILALGSGRLVRSGGGSGNTLGAIAVASFNRTAWGDGFLAPTYDTNGGGNSDVTFDPSWVQKALVTTSRYPMGISEY